MSLLVLEKEREILWDRRPYMAEFLGTLFFVMVGVGSIIASLALGLLPDDGATRFLVASAHGGMIALMVAIFGAVSGGHFNPAVTFAMLLKGEIGLVRAALYVLAQLGGALLAAFFLDRYLVRELSEGNGLLAMFLEKLKLGTPMAEGLLSRSSLIFVEVTLTALLVAVILRTAIEQKFPPWAAGLFIGGAVFLDILAGGPFTGAAMNPARAFGPAAVSGYWTNHWIYWAAPMMGACAGWLINEVTSRKNDRKKRR